MDKKQVLSTLLRKTLMALTGLFLCFFLVIHLLGNLQLLMPPEQAKESFNSYSHLLSGNIFIKIISYVLYASILIHCLDALLITLSNRKTAGKYAVDKRGASSKWYSRNMGILGTLILIFLVFHFKDFWYQYKFGSLPKDESGHKDLYTIVIAAYQDWWYVLFYVLSMFALGYHLLHGFFSAARSLGVYHPKYVSWIRVFAIGYSYAITIGFAIIPIYIYLTQHVLWN
ncbi:succinate dehydrogenase cytochrome b subunit [Pedobacter caeni]|uniref:Succinate dehydrogenase / fumarate reductase cytochrome b subunit n=1 Tax=Pedobacter caeni TaxID=288992 RepID=A0A1M4ZR78_9SPHI|nr:succinate dehydrogenase cytochrome b subunit [Pedobacter caeni]SHF20066.1 succinate dehydrogenase / fumarate reductase cytochrome b subunit [Pedobacter caeni]